MTPQQQLDVLGLVQRDRQIVVRDQRQEIGTLRKMVTDSRRQDRATSISGCRLRQARGAVAAAMGAPVPAPERRTGAEDRRIRAGRASVSGCKPLHRGSRCCQ